MKKYITSTILLIYLQDIENTAQAFSEYLDAKIKIMETIINNEGSKKSNLQCETKIEHVSIWDYGNPKDKTRVICNRIKNSGSKRIIFLNPNANLEIIAFCKIWFDEHRTDEKVILVDHRSITGQLLDNRQINIISKYSDLKDLAQEVLWGFQLAIYKEALEYPTITLTDELASTPAD